MNRCIPVALAFVASLLMPWALAAKEYSKAPAEVVEWPLPWAEGVSLDYDDSSERITEVKGATAPRLQLELLCARLALPGARTDDLSALAARLERLERAGVPSGVAPRGGGPTAAPADRSGSTGPAGPSRSAPPRTWPPA